MESYCNMNTSNRRNYGNPSDRSNCCQVNDMHNNVAGNCERQMGTCNRTMQCPKRMPNQCGREDRMANCHDREKRNVEVECVCQVKCKKDCHRHDDMEKLGCEFPVVMAYVPWQQWGDLYEADCGLMQGTIFKDLNFIFCGERC